MIDAAELKLGEILDRGDRGIAALGEWRQDEGVANGELQVEITHQDALAS